MKKDVIGGLIFCLILCVILLAFFVVISLIGLYMYNTRECPYGHNHDEYYISSQDTAG